MWLSGNKVVIYAEMGGTGGQEPLSEVGQQNRVSPTKGQWSDLNPYVSCKG